jgi:ankyrin repeat protein
VCLAACNGQPQTLRCLLSETKPNLLTMVASRGEGEEKEKNKESGGNDLFDEGWSVLHYAVKSFDELGLNTGLLLEYGADIEATNKVFKKHSHLLLFKISFSLFLFFFLFFLIIILLL